MAKKDALASNDIVTIDFGARRKSDVALTLPQRAAVALASAETELKLRELVESSADIVAVLDVAGREQAHRIAMNLKNARVGIEKSGKAAREDAVAFGKAVISEEKRLIDIVTGEENRVFALRDAFDAKLAAEKAEAERLEGERKAAIAAKVEAIRAIPVDLVSADSIAIRAALTDLAERELTKEEFAEQFDAANLALEVAGQKLMAMLADAEGREKAEAERIAAAEESARKVAEQAAANAREADRLAALKREADLAETERKRQADIAVAAVLAESNRLAAERAKLEEDVAAFKAQQESASKPVELLPPESLPSDPMCPFRPETAEELKPAIIDIAPDGGMFIFRAEPEAANQPASLEELGAAVPDAYADKCVFLCAAVRDLLNAGMTADGVRAIVEAELLA